MTQFARRLILAAVFGGLLAVALAGCVMPPLVNISVGTLHQEGLSTESGVAANAPIETTSGAAQGAEASRSAEIAPDSPVEPPSIDAESAQQDTDPDSAEGREPSLWERILPNPAATGQRGNAGRDPHCSLVDAFQLAGDAERAEFLEQACFLGEDK